MTQVIKCPKCNNNAQATQTRYGLRHDCCGLWSWGGKPLVSKEIHQLRKRFHTTFDYLWKRNLLRRNQAYKELSKITGLPEKQCHGAIQKCPKKLAILIKGSEKIREKLCNKK